MKIYQTSLPEVLILEPQLFPDSRGHFYEMWLEDRHSEAGIAGPFVQDNVSRSVRGPYAACTSKKPKAQKLVTVLAGRIFDVAVDIRPDSPTFKKWVGLELAVISRVNFGCRQALRMGFVF